MGNDGGTKLRRSDLVKEVSTKKSENSYFKEKYSQTLKFELCYLSKQPLIEPILGDYIGRMYNKTAVLEYLIAKQSGEKIEDIEKFSFSSLKDFVELKMTENHTQKKDLSDDFSYKFQCPLTNQGLGSEESIKKNIRFFYFAECGCVLSEQVITNGFIELNYESLYNDIFNYTKSSLTDTEVEKFRHEFKQSTDQTSSNKSNTCPHCSKVVSPYNIVYLYPSENSKEYDQQEQRLQHLQRLGMLHNLALLKRGKKKKNGKKRSLEENTEDKLYKKVKERK